MTIRRATNRDSEEVRGLVFSVLREYGLQPDPASTDRDLDDIEASYFRRGGLFAVLESPGGKIIGSYGLFAINSTDCELRKMYLHPAFRGRGLGKLLLEDALSTARKMKFEVVSLETARVLREAIALYLNYGFEPYEPVHLSARCDQAYRKLLR